MLNWGKSQERPPWRPRLCHVVTTPADQYTVGRRTRLEAEIALAQGFGVEVLTGWGAAAPGIMQSPAPGVAYGRLSALTKYPQPHLDLQALWVLYRYFRRQGFQVVHTHLAKAGVLGRLAAGLARVPVVVHEVHGPSFAPIHALPRRLLYILLERLAGEYTTHYIFVAGHLKAAYEARRIGPEAQKTVIYPGPELSPFLHLGPPDPSAQARLRAAWGLKPGDLVMGYVARLVPSKGHVWAIRALSRLSSRYPQLRLLLVGGAIWPREQDHLRHLQDLAAKLGVAEKVIFAGHQPQVLPYYHLFDLVVFPSLFEGTSIALLEALAAGLPVVAFDLPMFREVSPEGIILCPWGQVGGLVQGLEQALAGIAASQGRPRLSRKQREGLVHKFSAARLQTRLTDFYRQLFLRLTA